MRAVAVVTMLGCALGCLAACGRLDYASVPHDAGDGVVGRDSGGAGDGGAGDGGASGPLSVSNLTAAWTTPNGVSWTWERTGDGVGFHEYELVIGTSQDEVRTRGPGARVIGADSAPELGFWVLPDTDGDPVVRVLADELVPDTMYFAELRLIESGGGELRTGVALARTAPAASRQLVIFSDADTPGYSLPDTLRRDTTHPFAGSACYRYVSSCAGAPELCFDNLRRQEVAVDSSTLGAAGVLPNAFLEIAVSVRASQPSYWSEVWLRLGVTSAGPLARFHPLTFRADGLYHIVQIPIAKLTMPSGEAPTPAEAASGIFEFSVGGLWSDGAVVDIDEVRVRWPGAGGGG